MAKKLYEVYVADDMVPHFEEKLRERKDKIKIISAGPAISENCKVLMHYVMEAEEGIINPKWELK